MFQKWSSVDCANVKRKTCCSAARCLPPLLLGNNSNCNNNNNNNHHHHHRHSLVYSTAWLCIDIAHDVMMLQQQQQQPPSPFLYAGCEFLSMPREHLLASMGWLLPLFTIIIRVNMHTENIRTPSQDEDEEQEEVEEGRGRRGGGWRKMWRPHECFIYEIRRKCLAHDPHSTFIYVCKFMFGTESPL